MRCMITDGGDVSIETIDRVRELIDHVNHEPAALPTARAKSDIFRFDESCSAQFGRSSDFRNPRS